MMHMVPREATVVESRPEQEGVWTLTIAPDVALPQEPRPGQYNMLGLPGFGEAPLSFSRLRDDGRFDHTVQAVGRVTGALVARRPGQKVQFRGPFGRGWPCDEVEGKELILIGGGLGIAPLRPVVDVILAHRDAFGAVSVLCGARTPERMLFREELESWGRHGLDVRLTVDDVPGGGEWPHRVGVVTALLDHPSEGVRAGAAMVCGPELMMRFAARELEMRGMKPDEIFLSLERCMQCGIGQCGHCQIGPYYVCRDGPVFRYRQLKGLPDTVL